MSDLKIFCIDDEPRALMMLGQALEDAGHEVHCHKNPLTAVDTILSDKFAVILADIGMPGVNGFDIMHALDDANYGAICILLTGMEASQYADQAVRTGKVWKYLVKPIGIDLLQSTIAEAVEAYKEKYGS